MIDENVIDLEKVESLDFQNVGKQLKFLFRTEQDVATFKQFLANIQRFPTLSTDKRHTTMIELAYFKSQLGKFEKQVLALITKKKAAQTKAAIKKGKGAGERMTESLIQYYSEEDTVLESLESLYSLVVAWSSYMVDLYFMCGQTNKILG